MLLLLLSEETHAVVATLLDPSMKDVLEGMSQAVKAGFLISAIVKLRHRQ